jgi:hypothetical protein
VAPTTQSKPLKAWRKGARADLDDHGLLPTPHQCSADGGHIKKETEQSIKDRVVQQASVLSLYLLSISFLLVLLVSRH